MIDLSALTEHKDPFRHWVADGFVDDETVRAINAKWPGDDYPGKTLKVESYVRKGFVLFPQQLPPPAQALADQLASGEVLEHLSSLCGVELLPDPWLHEGPVNAPRLGGGLHDIPRGGMLKVHVDFEKHPTGLKRVANLLVYMNEDWEDSWGGHLELHGATVKKVAPLGGRAVFFLTTPESWHGHPEPLACPSNRSRRSLAMYYYARDTSDGRVCTVYRR